MSELFDFIGAKDDGGGGDNWIYKTCKAPVKSSPPTNIAVRIGTAANYMGLKQYPCH